jgi:hypothetical protein
MNGRMQELIKKRLDEMAQLDTEKLNALKILNDKLRKVQEYIINDAIEIDMKMKHEYGEDYELSFRVHYGDKNAWLFIASSQPSLKNVSNDEKFKEFYVDKNHNIFTKCQNEMQEDNHCWLFHELYHHALHNSTYIPSVKKFTKAQICLLYWEEISQIARVNYVVLDKNGNELVKRDFELVDIL